VVKLVSTVVVCTKGPNEEITADNLKKGRCCKNCSTFVWNGNLLVWLTPS
jgi:hypothetical protein